MTEDKIIQLILFVLIGIVAFGMEYVGYVRGKKEK
jgi:hypothetical protein